MALVLLVILSALIALAARADAGPYNDDDDGESVELPGEGGPGALDLQPARAAVGAIAVPEAELRQTAASAPHISTIVAAAYRTAGLDHDPTGSWNVRSRLAGLVPMLSARVGNNQSWREVPDPTIGHVLVFDVRATWRLDRLLFEPNELRVSAIGTSRQRERRRVAADAIHTYYAWVRARAAAAHDPRLALHAEEVTAELDALTNGWFSEILAKRSECR